MNLVDPDRSAYVEARMILQGITGLIPTLEHLQALEEYYEVRLIRIANALERVKQEGLNG